VDEPRPCEAAEHHHGSLAADTGAAEAPHHEKLGHLPLVADFSDKGETGERAISADEQRIALLASIGRPIVVEIAVGEFTVRIHVVTGELAHIVEIELHQPPQHGFVSKRHRFDRHAHRYLRTGARSSCLAANIYTGNHTRPGGASMQDGSIIHRITTLVDEEKQIRASEEDGSSPSDARSRLAEIEQTLDQCWDLLRQRRALREYNNDPRDAHVRDKSTVEHYEQ